MKKFKFFKSIVHDEIILNNGVTDTYLIQLSREIMSYSNAVYERTLYIDDATGLDTLLIVFNQLISPIIFCKIYSNRSFETFDQIRKEDGSIEYIKNQTFIGEDLLDCDNIIEYLRILSIF